MRILVRNDESKQWEFADPITARAEAELQSLLVESPSLIPISEIREGVSPLVLAVSEFGLPGSGSTDVLAFSPDGDIAVVECKLAANPESKRKVIGQILEYAAYLWGMDYEEVDRRVRVRRGDSLSSLLEKASAGEWDETAFREGVEQSLATGAFVLIIVVDQINEELRRIIRYVNECSRSAFSLHALEVRRFRAEGIEVLVPHLYGVSAKPPVGRRKKWTEEEFFEALGDKVERAVYSVIRELYDWSNQVADRVWLGTGAETGSFTFHYVREGKTISVFTFYTDGRLVLNYGWLLRALDQEAVQQFHRQVTELPGFKGISADFSKWPAVRVADAFKSGEDLEAFKGCVLSLRERIDASR